MGNLILSQALYHHLPTFTNQNHFAEHARRKKHCLPWLTQKPTIDHLIQQMLHWEKHLAELLTHKPANLWTMVFESLPSYSEITVAEAHRERGWEDLEATEKWHLALLTQGTHLFCAHEHYICGRGRCQDRKPRVFRMHSGNLSPVQGKRKMPKNRELAAEIRAR